MLSVNRNLVVGVRQRLRDVYVLIQKGVSVTLLSPGQSVEADCETFHRFQLWCVFSNATGQTTTESCSTPCNRRYNLTGTFLTETFVRQAGKKKKVLLRPTYMQPSPQTKCLACSPQPKYEGRSTVLSTMLCEWLFFCILTVQRWEQNRLHTYEHKSFWFCI